jgi:hypothetical protein
LYVVQRFLEKVAIAAYFPAELEGRHPHRVENFFCDSNYLLENPVGCRDFAMQHGCGFGVVTESVKLLLRQR